MPTWVKHLFPVKDSLTNIGPENYLATCISMPITWRIDTRQNFSGGNAVMRLGVFVSAYQMAFFPVKCKDIFLALMITTNIFLCWYEFSAEDKVFVSNWWILVIWQIPRGLIGVLIGWFCPRSLGSRIPLARMVIRGSLALGRRWKVGSSLPSRQSEEIGGWEKISYDCKTKLYALWYVCVGCVLFRL